MRRTASTLGIVLVLGVSIALVGWCYAASKAPKSGSPAKAKASSSKAKATSAASARRLSSTELIDRLTEEGKEGVGTDTTAWAVGFLPVDETPRFGGGIIGSAPPENSPVMTELVHRGVEALPLLLEHVSDARPTKLKVGKDFMGKWFADEYDSRYVDQARQPKDVNKVGLTSRDDFDEYVVKVGDLCYVAIGQIVNRALSAVRYQPSMCLVVNSPVRTPALASAVRQDWKGLTSEQHEESLYEDTIQLDFYAAPNGLVRLLHYYPKRGREVAIRLLNRPLADGPIAYDFTQRLKSASRSNRAKLVNWYRTKHGEVRTRELLVTLIQASTFPNTRTDPERNADKLVADQVLKDSFGGIDPERPGFMNVAGLYEQEALVTQLESFRWPEFDAAVYRLYGRAATYRPNGLDDRLSRGDCAIACARRLLGKGRDAEFRKFFQTRLVEAKRDFKDPKNIEKGYGAGCMQQIEQYEEFLKLLGRSAARAKTHR